LLVLQFPLEIKAGYLYPTNHVLREIYHNGGATAQVEAGVNFYDYTAISFNGQFFNRHGTALNSSYRTSIDLNSVAFLVKGFLFSSCHLKYYIGVGPRWLFFKTLDHSPSVQPIVKKNQVGASLSMGLQIFAWNFFFDPFVEYFVAPIAHFSSNVSSFRYDCNLDYWTFGMGVGYQF